MGQRFEGGSRTEDCGHGLRVDSLGGNFGALLNLHGEERRKRDRGLMLLDDNDDHLMKEVFKSSMPGIDSVLNTEEKKKKKKTKKK